MTRVGTLWLTHNEKVLEKISVIVSSYQYRESGLQTIDNSDISISRPAVKINDPRVYLLIFKMAVPNDR